MKKIFTMLVVFLIIVKSTQAQSWNITGNANINANSNYIGTSNANDLVFRTNAIERGRIFSTGKWRFGTSANYAQIDSAGKLTFGGNGVYQVGGNKYAFQYSGNPNYGLFFNQTNVQYEFRNSSAAPVFYVNANSGNGVFNGTLKIGAYTLPASDGSNGQVLTTNGTGTVNWSNVPTNANTSLSNLTAPTAVNVGLLPATGNSVNLGSAANAWRNLYLDSAIYINGKRFLSSGTGLYNTAVGVNTLNANTTGFANTGVGYQTLYNNQTGSQNIAIGSTPLFYNTSGFQNIALGTEALYNNNSGARNIAIGGASLFSNTTGYSNVALGYAALEGSVSGHNIVAIGDSALFHQSVNSDNIYENTAVGSKALYSNTIGVENTASGYHALLSNTTGLANTANGSFALTANTTGFWNTAFGRNALTANTTGSDNTATGEGALISNTTGEENTATGEQALLDNTTGSNNTATGIEALAFNTTGYDNTATGWLALYFSTTGNYNTAIGYEAGENVTDGSSNTFVGFSANCGSGGHIINGMALGSGATVTSGNHVVIGNSSVTSIGGYANWSNLSDGRVKKNIRQNVPGLAFINKLQPITYNLDLDAADKIIALPGRKSKDGKTIQPSQFELDSRKAKQQIVYTGFVAQDVEKAAKDLNYDFSGVDKPDNANTLYGLRYSDFVVPLVKAVQELSAKNDSLQKQNNDLESKYENQQKEIDELRSMMVSNTQSSSVIQPATGVMLTAASLEQNIPNPFNHTTTINYNLPQKFSAAQIIITDNTGKTLKQINISGAGKGSVNVDASTLASGAYNYSLIVDGRLITSKQMILAK